MRFLLAAVLLAVFSYRPLQAEEKGAVSAKPLPRVIVALYDAESEERPRYSLMHRFLEMPLNQLGFVVHYYHINAPLPELGDDVYGVIWFLREASVSQPEALMKWAADAVDKSKKVVVFGYLGVSDKFRSSDNGMKLVNAFLNKIGVNDNDQWVGVTYDVKKNIIDKSMMDFEKKLGDVMPPFMSMGAVGEGSVSHLQLIRQDPKTLEIMASDMAITSANGGYVAPGYGAYYDEDLKNKFWFLNPFKFLHQSLHDLDMPKPDVTTLDGLRIFYAQIDGDGWNNRSEVDGYREKFATSPDVIKDEIINKYPDFPFTVGLIGSEISKSCQGTAAGEQIARDILALPNVEPASHSHSHPLYWKYFADGNALKEEDILYLYGAGGHDRSAMIKWLARFDMMRKIFGIGPSWTSDAIAEAEAKQKQRTQNPETDASHQGYETENADATLKSYFGVARSYACEPFDIDREVKGSVDFINSLAPADKKVRLFQWSGDTGPFEEAVRKTREIGLRNINGGDTRFDPEYPSYAWVSPIGIRVGEQQQIFSSSSNENTYTQLWQGRFYGYKYLINTLENTDKPIRVKPFNLYFHIFSGEKQASLNALKENLEFARTQEVVRINASQYAAIADGFYSTKFIPLGTNKWRIENRGELQTIRFDEADGKSVDFKNSQGVLGQNRLNGSLYVALDPVYEKPVIAITGSNDVSAASRPYLVKSRWQIRKLDIFSNGIKFMANGYGTGEMQWKLPSGEYEVFVKYGENAVRNEGKHVNKADLINLIINYPEGSAQNTPTEVSIIRRD